MDDVILGYLPTINALYSLYKNYYILSMIFLMQIVFGVEYFNTRTLISKYIYAIYIILTVPYYIVISTYTNYTNMYINNIYSCLGLYLLSSILQLINYNESMRLYKIVHYIGNISTFIMLTTLPKLRIEYYIASTGERFINI